MRPCVLIFAGADPSGGAGIQADIQAVAAQGAHPLSVITALTAQDNNRVYSVHPVAAEFVQQQADVLIRSLQIAAVKIGIVGTRTNAVAIAECVAKLRQKQPSLPVVLDPVLASGSGDPLAKDNAVLAVAPLLGCATLLTPNLPEAKALCGSDDLERARSLLEHSPHILLKGGHGSGAEVVNTWLSEHQQKSWRWPRLAGSFHGTGCTLASASAAFLALGRDMEQALEDAQSYVDRALRASYSIAEGQRIPERRVTISKEGI